MSKKTVTIKDKVYSDFNEMREYYVDDSDYIERLIAKTIDDIEKLADFPLKGAQVPYNRKYRFLLEDKYLIYYRVDGDIVYIIRVLHGSRNCIKILRNEN